MEVEIMVDVTTVPPKVEAVEPVQALFQPRARTEVLQNEEILRTILSTLSPADLKSTITVATPWFRTSASVLWCSLEKQPIKRLFALLPLHIWDESQENRVSRTKAKVNRSGLSDAVTKSDLQRLRLYAPFVKEVSLGPELVVNQKHIQLLQMLQTYTPGAHILPNLHALSVAFSDKRLQLAILLLSPSVSDVEVQDYEQGEPSFPYWFLHFAHMDDESDEAVVTETSPTVASNEHICSFLEYLPDRAPNVTRIVLGKWYAGPTCDGSASVQTAIVDCLDALPNLREIALGTTGLWPDVLNAALTAKHLESLTINYCELEEDDKISTLDAITLDRPLLSTLLTLDISASTASILHLLSQAKPHLQRLRLRIEFPFQDTKGWLSELCTLCPTITELEFLFNGRLPKSIWSALSCCSSLKLKGLAVIADDLQSKKLSLQDTNLLCISQFWPDLIKLAINLPTENTGISEPSLAAILQLAQGCPRLQYLDLPVAYRSSSSRTEASIIHDHFKLLHLRKNAIAPNDLAKFVAGIWPSARVVGFEGSDKVNELLEMARYMRERMRGNANVLT